MKKIYFSLIICCILILTGCGKNDITKLEKNLSSMELTGDLIVKKVTGQPYIKGRHVVTGTVVIRDSLKKLN